MSTLLHRMPQDPLRPPEAPGMGRGFGFAVVAHLLLLAALTFSVHWHTQEQPAFEAELWSAVPQAAAPKEQEPPPEPQPEPTPPQPPQPSAQELQAQHDADIAIAKEREKKAEQQRQAEEAAQQKAKDEAKRKQEQAQKLADQQREQQLQKQQDAKAAKEAAAKADAQRQAYLKRIQGMAGATGDANATGTALRSSGPSSSYMGRVVARIKPNIIFSVGATNPGAEILLHVGPDGTILSRQLSHPSGDPDWDAAALRAIDKTAILPRDTDGTVPSTMLIVLHPQE